MEWWLRLFVLPFQTRRTTEITMTTTTTMVMTDMMTSVITTVTVTAVVAVGGLLVTAAVISAVSPGKRTFREGRTKFKKNLSKNVDSDTSIIFVGGGLLLILKLLHQFINLNTIRLIAYLITITNQRNCGAKLSSHIFYKSYLDNRRREGKNQVITHQTMLLLKNIQLDFVSMLRLFILYQKLSGMDKLFPRNNRKLFLSVSFHSQLQCWSVNVHRLIITTHHSQS